MGRFRTVSVDIYQLGNKGLESLDNRFRTVSVDIYHVSNKTKKLLVAVFVQYLLIFIAQK